MSRQIITQQNIISVLKYIGFYSLFILSVLFSLSNDRTFSILPDFSIIVIFFLCYFWFYNKTVFQAPLNLFLFGTVIDTYTLMPIGLSSFILLLSYKITEIVKSLFVVEENLFVFVRDCFIFTLLFYILRWFLFSYYMEHFYSFKYVLFDIIKNIVFCALIRFLYIKYKKNV